MQNKEKIQNHYKQEAFIKGLSKECSMQDSYVRDSETSFIINEIDRYYNHNKSLKILEIGCGNGYLLSILSNKYKELDLYGIEFSKELYELAISRQLENVNLINADCREQHFEEGFFDVVISERVLINLLEKEDKIVALNNIHRVLKEKGRYIMVESFNEPLANLNKARKELLLEEIDEPYHNKYFSESIKESMSMIGFAELEPSVKKNFLSTHYFLARVFHEVIRPENSTMRNTELVKFFDLALPDSVGNYSPILFRVFEKQLSTKK